jgi:hypothetical protein
LRRLPGFRAVYGESPRHLVALLASFAVCGYALARLLARDWFGVVEWVVGAALLHDLVLVPLYGGADRLLHRAAGAGRRPRSRWRTSVANHIRVPASLSLLLLLVYWPLVSRDVAARYRAATGTSAEPFRERWLAITGALFALSALHLAWTAWRRRRRG